ncbi:MAG: SpoIID/LytB domain-containing protein, partial [Anaerolineae bacterium]
MTPNHARILSSPSRTTGLGLLLLIGALLAFTAPATAWPLDPGAPPGPMVGGRVRDLVTLRPISGAEVSGAGRTVRTDDRGRFELHVPPGEHDLTARAAGHTAATAVGQAVSALPVRVDFELPPIQADHAAMAAAAVRVRSGGARAAVTADEPSGGAVQVVSAQAVVDVPATIRVLMPDGEIVEMDTDEYLKGVVPAEMGYVFARALEALKAQAIASRTYAARTCLPDSAGDPDVCEPGLDANVDTTTRTQVWRPTHYEVSDAAVVATHGQVVRYGGELVPALFFARARLRTLSSEDSPCCGGAVWPFLRSVASPDPFAARRGHGAGMSQEGAATLADWGADADEIVTYYYTSTTVDPPQPTPSATAATTSASIAGADGSAAAAGAAEGLGAAARAGDTTGSATRAISAARAGSATRG